MPAAPPQDILLSLGVAIFFQQPSEPYCMGPYNAAASKKRRTLHDIRPNGIFTNATGSLEHRFIYNEGQEFRKHGRFSKPLKMQHPEEL